MVPVVPFLAVPFAFIINAGILCGLGLLVLALLAVGLYLLLRNQQGTPTTWGRAPDRLVDSPPRGPLASAPVTTPRPVTGAAPPRAAQDGFWYHDPAVPAGTTLRYRCRVGGSLRNGSFLYQPGPEGQFIYTGGLATEVEIFRDLATGTTGTTTRTSRTTSSESFSSDSDSGGGDSSFDQDEEEEDDLPNRVKAGWQEGSAAGVGASFDSTPVDSDSSGGSFDSDEEPFSSDEDSGSSGGSFDSGSDAADSGVGASFSDPPAY